MAQLRLLHGTTRDRRSLRLRIVVFVAAVLGAVLGVYAIVGSTADREREAVLALSNAERAPVFAGAMSELETLCASDATAGLEAHCRERAEFVLKFPECDQRCREIAEHYLPKPTR